MGAAAAELAFPVVEQDRRGWVEECVAPHVALRGRPVRDAGEQVAQIAGLDTGESLFCDHRDPAAVSRLGSFRVN
jgi:hypothetical protein